jgi:hypothetical protein
MTACLPVPIDWGEEYPDDEEEAMLQAIEQSRRLELARVANAEPDEIECTLCYSYEFRPASLEYTVFLPCPGRLPCPHRVCFPCADRLLQYADDHDLPCHCPYCRREIIGLLIVGTDPNAGGSSSGSGSSGAYTDL